MRLQVTRSFQQVQLITVMATPNLLVMELQTQSLLHLNSNKIFKRIILN